LSRKPAATSGSVVAIANFKKVAACSVRYFLPGTIWFPVTTRCSRCDYALRRNPFRRNSTKVNLRRGACVRAGTLPVAASVLTTEEFAGFPVDEMKPGAGEANDGRIGIGIRFVLRRGLRKPMLHVRAQPWTFEKDMSAHGRNMQNPRAGSPPYVCVVGGLRLARKALNLPHPGPGRGRLTGAASSILLLLLVARAATRLGWPSQTRLR